MKIKKLEKELAEEKADSRQKIKLYKEQVEKLRENIELYKQTISTL